MKILPQYWYKPFVFLARLLLAVFLSAVAMQLLLAWPLGMLLEYMPPTIGFTMVAIFLLYYLVVIGIALAALKLAWSLPLSRKTTGESQAGH